MRNTTSHSISKKKISCTTIFTIVTYVEDCLFVSSCTDCDGFVCWFKNEGKIVFIVTSFIHNTPSVPNCPSVGFTITPAWPDLSGSPTAMWRTMVSGLVSKVIGILSVAGGVFVMITLTTSAGVLISRFDLVLTGVAPSTICLTLYIVRFVECYICDYPSLQLRPALTIVIHGIVVSQYNVLTRSVFVWGVF